MLDYITPDGLSALLAVIGIDLVLAGDNAIIIGMAAAGLPKHLRSRAILVGILFATVARIGFAALTTRLYEIVGMSLAGGLLLLWVCWKMWRELRGAAQENERAAEALSGEDLNRDGVVAGGGPQKTFLQATMQIVIADISMSLDNVLAVAGAAREHPVVLVIGLIISIALMGLAASMIARLLNRYRWIAHIGLAIILFVALRMIWEGGLEVEPVLRSGLGL